MLIATFGPSTDLAGKTITYENGVYLLEGHRQITATDVMTYDAQGALTWKDEGTRAMVGGQAARLAQSPPPLSAPAKPAATKKTATADGRNAVQKIASLGGLMLVVLGVILAFGFFACYDVTVEGEHGRVVNLGRMERRQSSIIVGIAMVGFGGVLMWVGRSRPVKADVSGVPDAGGNAVSVCPNCGGMMSSALPFCPHCGGKVGGDDASPPQNAV